MSRSSAPARAIGGAVACTVCAPPAARRAHAKLDVGDGASLAESSSSSMLASGRIAVCGAEGSACSSSGHAFGRRRDGAGDVGGAGGVELGWRRNSGGPSGMVVVEQPRHPLPRRAAAAGSSRRRSRCTRCCGTRSRAIGSSAARLGRPPPRRAAAPRPTAGRSCGHRGRRPATAAAPPRICPASTFAPPRSPRPPPRPTGARPPPPPRPSSRASGAPPHRQPAARPAPATASLKPSTRAPYRPGRGGFVAGGRRLRGALRRGGLLLGLVQLGVEPRARRSWA